MPESPRNEGVITLEARVHNARSLKRADLLLNCCTYNEKIKSTTFTVPFNNTRNLKLKAQPTNVFFATVNQMFGSSSQLPTTAEHVVIKLLWTVQATKQCSAVVGSWEELSNIWLTVAKNTFVGWSWNFRVRMLLKDTVIYCFFLFTRHWKLKRLFYIKHERRCSSPTCINQKWNI